MPTESNMIEYYDRRAPEYEQIYYREIPPRREEIDQEAERLTELVRGRSVLDLACGTGYWTDIMSKTAACITASDISTGMIEQARGKQYQASVDFVRADLYHPPFSEKNFDVVTLGFWLSHHPKPNYETLFEPLSSLVRPDGLIWMIDNNPPAEGTQQDSIGTDEAGNNYKNRLLENGEKYVILKNYFSKDDLLKVFSSSFEVLQIIFGKYYWSAQLSPR